MKLLNIILIYFFLATTASALDQWFPTVEACMTDSECELAWELQEPSFAPITSWGEWADVGCTEESRIAGSRFDQLCSTFEANHPYHQ